MNPLTWHGWVWRGARWVKICSAGTLGDCSRELGRLTPGVPARLTGLTGPVHGVAPTWRPQR